jgi:hypothetical protein
MNRVWLGTLGTIALMVFAPSCMAVLDWDFEAAPGTGGAGGDGGASISASSASTGGGGSGGGSSTGGAGGSGGVVNSCPGCTYGLRVGDDQEQTLTDMALASDGSLFFMGYYNGRVELDAANFLDDTVATGTQPFLAKLDRTGKPQWITGPLDWKNLPGSGAEIDIANNTLAWIGNVPTGSSRDTFLEVRDVDGERDVAKLRKHYGGATDDSLRSVALSPDGQTVYIAGAVNGQVNAGTFTNCSAVAFNTFGEQNILVLAIDVASGNCLWANSWPGGNHLGGSISIVTGSDGSPFISGHLVSGTIANNIGYTFPDVPTVSAPKYAAVGFVLKLNKANGAMVAAKGYPHAGFVSMAADRSTQTIMAGGAGMGGITFLGTTVPAAMAADDGADNVILAFDENLNEKWASITGGPKNQFCPHMQSNGAGRLYAACITNDKIDRGFTAECSINSGCSMLIPIQSATGALISNEIKTFGLTDPFKTSGKTFAAAATPNALAVGGTWAAEVQFWNGTSLDVTGDTGDFDIAVGKVEPYP